ncbi:shikimate dehydrogenase family protein [Aequorivita marina]|uniref:shikimate dehydrogenase family protein n=1 Tax=Aequorivita marina TaxID=3073654 RepID=UPI00287412B7|nr:shikimate dehydrogenase [Aequorivita sp. S2608]MDS1298077.1 shikimate dehydrogenase [Aequorivita sp. S2608]
MLKYGLVGKNISYSFSKAYFTEKFKNEGLPHSYENFDLPSINAFPQVIAETEQLKGLNVTIPYKEAVLEFLDELDVDAAAIGAVNTIKITKNNKLKGYNTDHYGFQKSLEPFLPLQKKSALILGTGGASKAIAFALKCLGFTYTFVSRKARPGVITYSSLDEKTIKQHFLIVNCTPLGTFPNIADCPPLPYSYLTADHLLYDLIYNPSETTFLKHGKLQEAQTVNGLEMLKMQAERAWQIWNS